MGFLRNKVHIFTWMFVFFIACFLNFKNVSASSLDCPPGYRTVLSYEFNGNKNAVYVENNSRSIAVLGGARNVDGTFSPYNRSACVFSNKPFIIVYKGSLYDSDTHGINNNFKNIPMWYYSSFLCGSTNAPQNIDVLKSFHLLPYFESDSGFYSLQDSLIVERYLGNISTSADFDLIVIPSDTIFDENGNLIEKKEKYDKLIGYPHNFIYKKEVGSKISNSASDYYHSIFWKNPFKSSAVSVDPGAPGVVSSFDYNNYKLQLQFKGTYKVKKTILSEWETVLIPFFDVADLDAFDLNYRILSSKFDNREGGIVYDKIVKACGYKPFRVISSVTSQVFRARYYKLKDNKLLYGDWVRCTMSGDGTTTPVVTDENDNIITTPEYGDGVSQDSSSSMPNSVVDMIDMTNKDFLSKIIQSVTEFFKNLSNLSAVVGQVPELFRGFLSFLPSEIWGVITLGIGGIVFLRFFGR